MDKFIFVCYEHGTGGESLSVELSQLPFCQTLRYEKHAGRTWTYDCFDKLFLRNFQADWISQASQIKSNSQIRVVPSHYRPEELMKLFNDAIFVVINSPKRETDIASLLKRIYRQVWLTKHDRLDQKIGYFIQNSGRKPDRDQIKIMSRPITNGGIQCLINSRENTRDTVKKLFRVWARNFRPSFHYNDESRLLTIEYLEMDRKTIGKLKSKLTNLINNIYS